METNDFKRREKRGEIRPAGYDNPSYGPWNSWGQAPIISLKIQSNGYLFVELGELTNFHIILMAMGRGRFRVFGGGGWGVGPRDKFMSVKIACC